jgi:hypothetical protein
VSVIGVNSEVSVLRGLDIAVAAFLSGIGRRNLSAKMKVGSSLFKKRFGEEGMLRQQPVALMRFHIIEASPIIKKISDVEQTQ